MNAKRRASAAEQKKILEMGQAEEEEYGMWAGKGRQLESHSLGMLWQCAVFVSSAHVISWDWPTNPNGTIRHINHRVAECRKAQQNPQPLKSFSIMRKLHIFLFHLIRRQHANVQGVRREVLRI